MLQAQIEVLWDPLTREVVIIFSGQVIELADRCDSKDAAVSAALNHCRPLACWLTMQRSLRVLMTSWALCVGLILLFSSRCTASQHLWTEPRICQAVVSAYFYLAEVPSYRGQVVKGYQVIDASGQIYVCRFQGARVSLTWDTHSHVEVSEPILALVAADILIVKASLAEQAFTITHDRVSAIQE